MSLASAYKWRKGECQRQDHEDCLKTRPAFRRNTQGSWMRNGDVSRGFQYKKRAGRGRKAS